MIDFRGATFDVTNRLVSIGVASYNNGAFVLDTLDSIYHQKYAPIELIIVDDASTDDSVHKIGNWIESRNLAVSFVKNRENLGVCKVCNLLLDQARGYYFVLISSDDEMHHDRIGRQVSYFNSLNDDCGIVYSDMSIVDRDGSLIQQSWIGHNKLKPLRGNQFKEYLMEEFRFASPTVIYKKEALQVAGRYDEGLATEDVDMILRVLRYFKAEFCDANLVRYRVQSGSLSRNIGGRYYEDRIMIYKKHLGINAMLDQYIRLRISEWASTSYKIGYPKAKWLLRISWKTHFTLRNFCIWLLACAGIRIESVSRIIKMVKR